MVVVRNLWCSLLVLACLVDRESIAVCRPLALWVQSSTDLHEVLIVVAKVLFILVEALHVMRLDERGHLLGVGRGGHRGVG